jgi:hypothetical protein
MRTWKFLAIGFLLAMTWTIGQWMTNTAITYWIEKLKPLSVAKGIYF